MGFLDRIDRIFNRGKAGIENPYRGLIGFPNVVPTDLRLSPEESLSVSAVFGCVRVISEALASSPWCIYAKNANGESEELEDDPIGYLLNCRPNPESTAQAFKEALIVQTLVYGNGFAEIVRDAAGRVAELWLLTSDRVIIDRTADGSLIYRVRGQVGSGPTEAVLAPEQVFHLRGLSSVSQLMGDSQVSRASKAIAAAHAADRFTLNYFSNGASVGGVLKLSKAPKDAAEEDEVKARWAKQQSGVKNAYSTVFLGPGMEYTPLDSQSGSAQMVPNRQFSVDEILRFFGVPGALMNQNAQLPGQDIEGLGLMFVRHTLRPWMNRLSQEAEYKLFPQRSPWKHVEIDVEWLIHGNAKAVADTMSVYLNAGVLSVNEVREELGYNPVEGGDMYKGAQSPQMPSDAPGATDQVEPPPGSSEGSDDSGEASDSGLVALHRLVLSKHKDRLKSREEDLRKTLKNGVLAEKMAHAKDWSRQVAESELMKAGVSAPPNWMAALDAIEAGGDPTQLARSLNEVTQ